MGIYAAVQYVPSSLNDNCCELQSSSQSMVK